MDIGYLIQLLNNKLTVLATAKDQAFTGGDLDRINSIDAETLAVQNTLVQLNLVQQITSAAAAGNTTPADVIANGLTTIQNTPVIPSDPTAVLSLYDLSTYASDPLYLQKITDILANMPALDSAPAIDAYISGEAIGSPLTGQIIFAAAQQYVIDTRLLAAILELESNFGTAGVAVSTLNPGNVGNTGSSTRTYNSWQDGVAAVAQWLSLHPVLVTPTVVDQAIPNSAPTPAPVITPAIPLDPSAFVQTTPVVDVPVVIPPVVNSTTTDSSAATTTPDQLPPVDQSTSTPDVIIDPNATSTDPSVATSSPVSMNVKVKTKKRSMA